MSVGGRVSWSAALLGLPLVHLEEPLGVRVDGILGAPLFARYIVELDYQVAVLRIWEPAEFEPPATAHALAIELGRDMLPHARVSLEPEGHRPVEARLLLDTGANLGVALTSTFVQWKPDSSADRPAVAGQGVGGAVEWAAETTADVVWDGMRIPRVGVKFSARPLTNGTQTSRDGLLGGRVLRGFRVAFDYSGRTVYVSRPPPSGS